MSKLKIQNGRRIFFDGFLFNIDNRSATVVHAKFEACRPYHLCHDNLVMQLG